MPTNRPPLAAVLAPALAPALALALSACAAESPPPTGPVEYAGALAVTPSPARFEDTYPECVRELELRLENTGSEPIAITGATLPSRAFGLRGPFPRPLEPGETERYELSFAPAKPGDASGFVRFKTDEGPVRYPLATTAVAVEPPAGAVGALDMVFVVDISTTMRRIPTLRKSIRALFDEVESKGLDVRLGLTTFENDVVLHRRGAFLDRESFFAELDSQLVEGTWEPNPELPRQRLNFEGEENMLEALYRSASFFEFRPEARRYLLLMTDDTFLEPPAVFSDGTPATRFYADVAELLEERGIQLFSVHAEQNGRGLSADYAGQKSLVALTGGAWFELSSVDEGALIRNFGAMLARPDCRR